MARHGYDLKLEMLALLKFQCLCLLFSLYTMSLRMPLKIGAKLITIFETENCASRCQIFIKVRLSASSRGYNLSDSQ